MHCMCLYGRNAKINTSINLMQLDDNDVASDRVADKNDISDDLLKTQSLPIYSTQTRDDILKMQNTPHIKLMKEYVSKTKQTPSKKESITLTQGTESFLPS